MRSNVLGLVGIGQVDISGLVAGIFVIGVVQGAYTTEVLRGAIKAVPAGQIEAARAYGMSPFKVMTRVTLPAMLPYAIPGLSNLWLIATKDTALLAVVGFSELTLVTRQAAGSTKAYLLFFCAAGAADAEQKAERIAADGDLDGVKKAAQQHPAPAGRLQCQKAPVYEGYGIGHGIWSSPLWLPLTLTLSPQAGRGDDGVCRESLLPVQRGEGGRQAG